MSSIIEVMPAASHQMSKHPLYRVWQDIKRRCYDPNFSPYPYYGGVGVTVCEEWLNHPEKFIEWALSQGWVKGMDIDKDIKQAGNKIYSPEMCSIVSHRDNMLKVVGRESGRKTSKLKLSVSDVENICKRKALGEKSQTLADQYQVDVSTINKIWKKNH